MTEPDRPDVVEISPTEDLRCSVLTSGLGEPPVGTAGGAHRYLLVELPAPWPQKIDTHPLLAGVDPGDGPVTVSILGIRAMEMPTLDRHRIVWYERTDPFRGFAGREITVPTTDLATRLRAAVDAADPDPSWSPIPDGVEDVLVCTHGSRDRCCGQLGTRLHARLDGELRSPLRLWRTSHIGGHRFAPTAIHFPDGNCWAHMTDQAARDLLDRSARPETIAAHHRGNVGMSERAEQIAESEAFVRHGWPWLDEPRSTHVETDGDGTVTVLVSSPLGDQRVRLAPGAPIPVPACGEDLDRSRKSSPQFRVLDVDRG